MQAQTTLPSKACIYHQWRKQDIPGKNRFKQYIATNPALEKIQEGKSQTKEANNTHNNISI